MKLLESNRNTSQQLTRRLIYKLSMLSIHGSILYPPSRIALKVALRQGEFANICIYIYVYILYIYIDLLVRNVLRLGSFQPPRLAAQPSRPPLRQLTFAELPVTFASSSKPQNKLQCTVSISLCVLTFFVLISIHQEMIQQLMHL